VRELYRRSGSTTRAEAATPAGRKTMIWVFDCAVERDAPYMYVIYLYICIYIYTYDYIFRIIT